MADFVQQMGGTEWAGVSTQYFQNGAGGEEHITNPTDVLAGHLGRQQQPRRPLQDLRRKRTRARGNTYTDLGAEAARAAKHFHVNDLANADFVIAQPQSFSDPNAYEAGYCAFHDYTEPGVEKGIYNGITAGHLLHEHAVRPEDRQRRRQRLR